jgi:hypothetical protein
MLIAELFSRGIMKMGPSRTDATRQVGVFDPEAISTLPALRTSEMEKFRWLAGEWNYENQVPATSVSPAYSDAGSCKFSYCEKNNWICRVAPDGRETCHITFDPFSRQWIYLLFEGSYGILRSRQGWTGEQIVFSGLMTMLGIDCDWRLTWTKKSDAEFGFLNEERNADGTWAYIDHWKLLRKR